MIARIILVVVHVVCVRDSAQRARLSARIGRGLTVGYRLHRGYSGDVLGLYGSVVQQLSPRWILRGHLDLSSVERYTTDEGDELLAAVAAVTWRPAKTLSVDAQAQGLRNPSYDSDLRLLLRGSWRFRR